jgi:DNA end-binding protein Ku
VAGHASKWRNTSNRKPQEALGHAVAPTRAWRSALAVNAVARVPARLALKPGPPVVFCLLGLLRFRSFPWPRANWKGFLAFRRDLPGRPLSGDVGYRKSVQLINRKTGHRIKYAKVDADTGEEVASEDIIKGYKVDTDTYIEVTKDELDDIALESAHTIEIDEFVPKTDIDNRYLIRPYYLVPDGKVGHDAFAVIRETIRSMNKVAIGRVVLTNREHIIALEPLDKGLMGTLLRYPYGCAAEGIFRRHPDAKPHMLIARHTVERVRSFGPSVRDHYEAALIDLINKSAAAC